MVDAAIQMLAQLPSSYMYVHPFKLVALVLGFTLWAILAHWVDKDTVAVNTFRHLWNPLVLATGVASLLVALFVPLFAIAFPAFIVMNAVIFLVYVVHRNGLVRDDDKVLTAAHLRRLKEEGLTGKKKPKEVKERVMLRNAEGKRVEIPEEEEERERYRLTQELLWDVLWHRAAVAELVPFKEQSKVTYEVDGIKVEREPLERSEADETVQYLKQLAGLNLEERRKPQLGQITANVGENRHKTLIKTDGSTAGEKLSLRIYRNEETLKVPDLGFNPKQLESVMALREVTPGLILLSAPPSHGLTTTIYSFTRTHDRFLQNVQTIEFEREMDIDNVTQRSFSLADGKTFTEQLLKLVRSDPDIIVLPELRDRESAAVASQAASQKQKIYVGLVANDIFEALRKWITLVGDKKLVAKSVLAVANQRLVRKLCGACKQAYKPDAAMMRKLNLPADKVLYRPPEPEYDKHGNLIACPGCQGTGYVGRTAVFDWLSVDDGLREVVRRSTSFAEIQSYVVKKGGVGLQAQALEKVLEGITSIQEVARVVRRGDGAAAGRAKPKPARAAATPKRR
jgi:type II secretory ATPase GspE/PulE/Tfp pilus assembly ATPase PilB-like protein